MADGSIQIPPPPTPITVGGAKTQVQPNPGQGYGSVTVPPPPTPIAISGSSGPSTPQTSNGSGAITPDPNSPTPGTPSLANVGYNLSKLPGEAYSAITSLFPGAQIGNAIGTSANGIYQAIKQRSMAPLQQAAQENGNNFSKIVGDTASAVVTPATLAMGGGEGATVAGRIANAGLKYGAGGAVAGAGSAAAQGGTPTQVGVAGLQGGLYGALGGAGGQAVGEAGSALSNTGAWQKVQKIISPNITAAEGRAAMEEGRVTRGGQSLLGGKKPDIVAPSPETQKQTQTILNHIPNAGSMNDAQLGDALDERTTAMAQQLKPQLQAIPIGQSTTGKAFDAWNGIKEAQTSDPDFLDNQAGNTSFQNQFERRLNTLQWDIQDPATGKMKAPTPKNANDVWEARKDYDNSIPPAVKNATDKSAPVQIYRQKMWLQNRAILNDILNDVTSSLDNPTRKAFSDMTDMYSARQNIVKNTKIDTKGAQGLLSKGLIKGAGIIGTGLGLGTGAGLLGEHLLNPSNP